MLAAGVIGFVLILCFLGWKTWNEEGRPMPRTSTVALFMAAGFIVLIMAKQGPTNPQEQLDAEARELIRQHNAQVDRDMHEWKVRARAREMMRGR